jgi:hypothetical protein
LSAANLVVLRDTVLRDSHSYKFTVTAHATDNSRQDSQAYIILQPNLPPSGGTCSASPGAVIVLKDLVTVMCLGWEDLDDVDSELLYEIKVRCIV